MEKMTIASLIGLVLLAVFVMAADFTPQGNINLRDTYNITGAPYINATLYYGNASEMTGTILLANSSENWDALNVPTDLNNLLTLDWENITNNVDISVTTLNVSTHFIIDTVNITCFDSACNFYINATDSCMYYPSGGKDCGAA